MLFRVISMLNDNVDLLGLILNSFAFGYTEEQILHALSKIPTVREIELSELKSLKRTAETDILQRKQDISNRLQVLLPDLITDLTQLKQDLSQKMQHAEDDRSYSQLAEKFIKSVEVLNKLLGGEKSITINGDMNIYSNQSVLQVFSFLEKEHAIQVLDKNKLEELLE